MEDAAEKKARTELFEHKKRTELLSGTCEIFRMAKARLLHENNKIRDAEKWERYINTDRKPYPDNVPDMHNHLYLWKQSKESEYMEFALSKCNSYVDTLLVLDDLIEYPLYASTTTINNWKEVRREWREEFMNKIDKACFNMIKNLVRNFKQEKNQSHIFSFEDQEEHVTLAMCAYAENKTQGVRLSPKISFSTMDVEVVMPAVYRTSPFILRIIFLDQDFLSETSLTYYSPEPDPMEPDLLKEIQRCFEAKKEAKSLVADREREKVRQAKQKVLEAQAAARQAEMSFHSFQSQNLDQTKKRESRISLPPEKPPEEQRALQTKKKRLDVVIPMPGGSTSSLTGAQRRARGIEDGDGESVAQSLMQSMGNKRTVDAISMRSAMRKKQDRTKKIESSSVLLEGGTLTNVFWTQSMISISQRENKLDVKRASELCFEENEEEEKNENDDENNDENVSYNSLDLMFGPDDAEEYENVRPIRQLIKDTVVVDRDPTKSRLKSAASFSFEGKKGRRRGKSTGNPLKSRGPVEESDENQQTASDVFETAEDTRQEHYMSSLLFTSTPKKKYHVNLREYCLIGGTFLLDIISHESQPRSLLNGDTVQIFYGEMNVKVLEYKYDYKPPPPAPAGDEPVVDPGLQNLLHVKVHLPKGVLILTKPVVALWDREEKYWTREHVHKVNIDLDSHSASFSIGRALPFAFFMKKYELLPFDSWTIKPNLDTGGVLLSLYCPKIFIEFCVEGFQICLSKAVNMEQEVILEISDIIGEFMHLHKLLGIMKSRGLNVFPDHDGFLYCRSSCKDVVLEDHTYLSIAMFADSLEFQSWELNTDFKRRRVAFRVREFLGYQMELRFRSIIASTLSAHIYRIGIEDSFTDETKPESTYGFCPDVYTLLDKAFAHVHSSSPLNPVQVVAVYNLLSRVKVLSYSGFSPTDKSLSSSESSSKRYIKKKGKKSGKGKSGKSKRRSSNQSLSIVMSNATV